MKNFLIYRSSAGSGKTYTLVKEYLKLVLNEPENFKSTLAVTFTNKAAGEMKSRIIDSLTKLSRGGDDELKQKLVSEGVKGNIEVLSAIVLKNILHKYSYFSVSTIDSFFHKVIRSFARELKLQLGYKIELDEQSVLDKITDKLLNDAGIDIGLTGFLEDFIYHSIDDEKGWKIDLKIKELAKEIFSERYLMKLGTGSKGFEGRNGLKEFIDTLFAIKKEFENGMKQIAEEADKLLGLYSLVIDDFPYKKSGFMNYLVNSIATGKFEPGQRARVAAGDINKWFGKNSKPAVRPAAEAGLYKLLVSAVENFDSNYINYNTATLLIKTIYITGIFKDLTDQLRKYRDDNNVLLISDINNLLLNVISGNSSPFVYEKTGSFYRNFLIDEFQDTSTFQWRNFFPLIENSLSENYASLIVGDVKQSIYRWRNGNMKLLLEEVKNDLAGFEEVIKEETLKVNYRSKKGIVDFNNSFFSTASGICSDEAPEEFAEVISRAYEDTVQEPADKSSEGYVRIKFYNNDEKSDVTSREYSIVEMISMIKHLLQTSGYTQKDIMVLVRNNSDAVEAAHALIDARLSVVSSDSLLLTNSPKVRLLINIFRYIVDNNSVIAQAEILYNYLVYIKHENIGLNEIFTDHLKKENKNNSLFNKYLPEDFFDKTSKGEVNSRLSGLGLYDLAEELVMMFGLGDIADTYLIRFLDVLKQYSAENNSDVYGFVNWWEENKENNTIIVPDKEDAVRVMTIHKAKGLQAPVVFIPFANWEFGLNSARNMIWASSEIPPYDTLPAYYVRASSSLEKSYFAADYNEESALTYLDNLNLMYVAFTRAEEMLFVSVPQKGRESFNAGQLIFKTLTANPELVKSFNSEFYEYESGTLGGDIRKPGEDKQYNSYKTKGMVSGNVLNRIIIKPEFENYVPETNIELKQLKNRGIIIHKALSLIRNSTLEEIVRATQQLVIAGLISSEQKTELAEELRKILEDDRVKKWFHAENVMNERDIVVPANKIRERNKFTYRPDKVIIENENASVIDFKTGGMRETHKAQIREYGDILAEMGYKVRLNLLYINKTGELHIEEVF